MPLPWVPGQQHVLAPNVVNRAMTVRQLSELRLFLRRLCKAQLLRYTDASPFAKEKHGQPIDWFEINLYHITAEVIKKVIPEVVSDGRPFCDMDGNEVNKPPAGKWCSWSEMVMTPGKKRQTAAIMFSHWWGGSFRDFMVAVDQLVADKALSTETMIWVCTFANNQFGEDFGSKIMDCPFIKVLGVTHTTIMIVDRFQGSLSRTWCGLELHYSLQHDKELEIYTSSGRVGSARASSGPLVEAVKQWDIRRTECSEDSYRRQILNYIAQVDETAGLMTESGSLVVDAGRPLLDESEAGQALDPELPRENGEGGCEYAHESRLFRKHNKAFEDLNMMVRLEVMAKIGKARKREGCVVESPGQRGITLGQWRTFARKVQDAFHTEKWQTDDKVHLQWGAIVIQHVRRNYIQPRTHFGHTSCSYMELVSDGPQCPNFFVSHLWRNPFRDLVACIEQFAEAKQLADGAKIWIDLAAVDLNPGATGPVWDSICSEIVPQCEGLFACLGKTKQGAPARFWCLAEYETFGRLGKDIYLGCSTGAIACCKPFPGGEWVFGNFKAEIARQVRTWRFENSAINPKHAEVRDRVQAGFSCQADNFYNRFNAQLCRWSAGPVLRTAASRGLPEDVEEIRTVCRTPGLWVNSASLSGASSETALHVATAGGHLEAMRALLESKMDVNAEDDIRERPLHYAALAGQAESAKLLLEWGADPHAESSYRETALHVAEQSPAEFLKTVSTADVQQVLREHLEAEAVPSPLASARKTPEAREASKAAPPAPGGALAPADAIAHADVKHLRSIARGRTAPREALVELLQGYAGSNLGAPSVDRLLAASGALQEDSTVNLEAFLEWLFHPPSES